MSRNCVDSHKANDEVSHMFFHGAIKATSKREEEENFYMCP